ncbi:hypothetical protein PV326_013147 [Microctonus aethiopoides]|nr:hypothetical protein PV326_013147 [Microctonus aethiopoides]
MDFLEKSWNTEALQGIDERIMVFLTNQRKPERIGFIGDIQTIYDEEMDSIQERRRKAKYEREKSTIDNVVQLVDSSQSTRTDSQASNFSSDRFDLNDEDAGPSRPKKSRGTVNILTDKLVATLDKCLISVRNAVRIVSAVAEVAILAP